MATSVQRKEPGGSWEHARELLLKMYGYGRRALVYRMLVVAQALPMPVLDKLESVGVHIQDNVYFVGHRKD